MSSGSSFKPGRRRNRWDCRKVLVGFIILVIVVTAFVYIISIIKSHKSRYFREGLTYYDDGKYDEALLKLEDALQEKQLFSGRKDMNIRLYIADIYMQTGEYDQAVSEYNAILDYSSANENKVTSLKEEAQAFYDFSVGNYAGSVDIFLKKAEAGQEQLYLYAGACYSQIGDSENMFSCYEKYISEYGFNSYLYAQYAGYYMNLEDLNKAKEYIDGGLASDSSYRAQLILLEIAYYEKLEDFNQAFSCAKDFVNTYPDNYAGVNEYIFLATRATDATEEDLQLSDELAEKISQGEITQDANSTDTTDLLTYGEESESDGDGTDNLLDNKDEQIHEE